MLRFSNNRYENIEHIVGDYFIADIFHGKTAKVPHPTIFTLKDNLPEHHVGWITRPQGWRKTAGYIDVRIHVGDNVNIHIETKDAVLARELALTAVRTFMS